MRSDRLIRWQRLRKAHPAWGDAIKSEAGQAWLKTLPQHELQEFFTTERTSR